MDELVSFGSRGYFGLLSALLVARAADFLSTWIGTPNLVLEGNPIAKRIGWRLGIALNLVICLTVAVWPLPALVIITSSLLIAARNFQSAWLMRCLGEESYRCWIRARLQETNPGFYVFCLAGQSSLVAAVGLVLIWYSPCSIQTHVWHMAPFGVGLGILTYAIAIFGYTMFSIWRLRRH